MHSGLFGWLTKLDAKRAEQVQKFVPRSHDGIFRNEHTLSTPLDPKLTFWCVSYYLGAFGTIWLPYETRCKTSRTSSKVRETKSHRIFVAFHTIWVHSGPLGCLTKLGAKRAELVQKFVPRTRVGIFRNVCSRSTPLDPKLMFRCISYYMGAFGTVCLLTEVGAKRAKLVQKFVPRSRFGMFHNERTRSTPIGP